MADISPEALRRLQSAYRTAVESYVLYGEMDSEACYERLEFIAELLGDVLDDLGIHVDDLANDAVGEQFSPFAPAELDEYHALALNRVRR